MIFALYISIQRMEVGEWKMAAYETVITEDQKQQIEKIINYYRGKPGGLIPVLHEIQKVLGYLPRWVQEKTSEELNIPLSGVNSIISFYSLFSEKPKGKYNIGVCKGTACYVRGSDKIIEKLEEVFGIEAGDTTPDGIFSIEVLRCLGACGLGPVMTVNEEVYTRIKPDKVKEIIDRILEKEEGRNST